MYDFDAIEFDANNNPVLYQEMKHGNIKSIDLNSHQLNCLRNIAKDIPLMVTVYYPPKAADQPDTFAGGWMYYLIPANEAAIKSIPGGKAKLITEAQYIWYLYRCRGLVPPMDVISGANKTHYDLLLPEINPIR